ncbi:MAG: serine/threonine protein kinase [Symploca sp. SIO1B1]|nr:serine/threonine protein kinase [Symploca sp. SIO1B1]
MALSAGDKLYGDKYTIEKELGRGRFSITYRVNDHSDNRFVIKTLDDLLINSLNPSEQDRLETKFFQEALKLTSCNHPNIVKVRDSFQQGSKSYIVMDYIDGVSLADRAQKVLTEQEALRYIQQVGEALMVAHQQGVIHRDVKPGNIIERVREGKPEAILIDFGLALFDHDKTVGRTKEASAGFTAIELYSRQAQKPGHYTDVYSLAATLYALVTGKTPVSAIKRKLDNERLVPPQEINNQISKNLNRQILWGLELKPQKRPQSIKEWLDALGIIIDKEHFPEGHSSPVLQRSLDKKIKLWTLVAALITAVGVMLSGIGELSGWFQPDSSPSPSASPTNTQ